MKTLSATLMGVVLFFCVSVASFGLEVTNPEKTRVVLLALLTASNEELVLCDYDARHEDGPPATVKELLATALARLAKGGKSWITGSCSESRCSIGIYYSDGEDVMFADIRFKTKNGKARVETIECHITP